MQKRKKTRSQTTYQIATNDYILIRIFNKKTIIITYFILNFYLENIDKNYRKLKNTARLFTAG
jgi:hypothetical protein